MSSPLRTQFINHLTLPRRSPKTKEAYISAVYGLTRHYMTSPDKLSGKQIQDYLRYLIEKRKLAWSTCNVIFSGLICFYKNILNRNKTVFSIAAEKFIHRFLLHVLPERFVKIRYYGFLAHTNKNQSIPIIFKLINPDAKMPEKIKETICEMMLRLTGTDITLCPECKKGKFIISRLLPAAWNTS